MKPNLEMFAGLMIQKIETVSNSKDSKTPWFNYQSNGMPENLNGRAYSGMNALFLFLVCEKFNYDIPVFLTFNQAKEQNLMILKGSKSYPVNYWNFTIKDDKGRKIDYTDYLALSSEEKAKYQVTPFLKYYNVFNIDQTNLKEINPERYEALRKAYIPTPQDHTKSVPVLDMLFERWECPIRHDNRKGAYYSPVNDYINVPEKAMFESADDFYSVTLHEITHSTGAKNRLNRLEKTKFGDAKYAKEELVAEMTAALNCVAIGVVSTIREENAQYLKSWLDTLKEEPNFLLSLLSDISKASDYINRVIETQCRDALEVA